MLQIIPPPPPLATINEARLGIAPPPVWPTPGAVTAFDFTQPEGTALESLPGWTRTGGVAGAAKIGANNRLDFDATTSNDAVYTYETGNRAHYIEGQVFAGNNSSFPLCVRVVDANNFIGARANGTGTVEIVQRVSGTNTNLLTKVAVSAFQILRLEARADDTVALYANGRLVGSAVAIPSALTAATKVGMSVRSTDITGIVGAVHVYAGAVLHGHAPGIGNWWHEPRAITANGKTWIGTSRITGLGDRTGASQVSELNHATGAVTHYSLYEQPGFDDEHNYPVFLIRPDGRLVAFYSGHHGSAGLHMRISVHPYDASAWGEEVRFAVPADGGVTYPSPVMLSAESNKVYVFYRNGLARDWAYVTSTNLATATAPASDGAAAGTVTWAASTTIMATGGQGIYHKPWSNNVDRIDFAITDAIIGGFGPKRDVRHVYYQGGVWRDTYGKPLGSLPIALTACTPIATSGPPDNMGDVWMWDMARDNLTGVIQVVFAHLISKAVHQYYYARWDGQAWRVTALPGGQTGPLTSPTGTESYYSPGICVDGAIDGLVYASIGDHTTSAIWRYVTLDGGRSWTRTRISPPSEISGARWWGENVRPFVPRDRVSAVGVLWARGTYQYYTALTDYGYQTEIMSARV